MFTQQNNKITHSGKQEEQKTDGEYVHPGLIKSHCRNKTNQNKTNQNKTNQEIKSSCP